MKKFLPFVFLFFYSFSYAQTGIWGATSVGGHYNGGAIFRTDGSGNNYTLKKSMFQYAGEYAKSNLLQASNGKMYGMTSSCCVFGAYGIFFQFDPVTKEYDKLFDFNDTINGSDPQGGLIQATDGKLYGMTCKGGIQNWGVIFQYDPATAVFTKKYDFDDKNGSYPQNNLLQATDGKFYGLTNTGGANDYGVLFQFDPVTLTYSKKFDFDGQLNGSNPLGSLIQAKNGKLYGLTSSGGKNEFGVLFEYDPSNSTYTKKFDFDGVSNGGHPYNALVEAGDGNLYGLTAAGGKGDFGVLFQFSPSASTYAVKLEFNDAGNGANPKSALTLGKNGKLYGTTENGGSHTEGVLFEYDPVTSSFVKKFDFNNDKLTGKYPIGSLMQSPDGKLYGMNYTGGISGVGVLYQFDPATSTYKKEFDFHASSNGNMPASSLMLASDKMVYGVTQTGGLNNEGTIYQYDPALDLYKKKFDFEKMASGASPISALMQASNGKIYGTTMEGGANDKGVLFQFDPATNVYSIKLEFDGNNGSNPYGELIQANNGKIYGMTREGGKSNNGVIFQFDPLTSIYTKKFDFDDDGNGKYPEGGLTQGVDGKLYGVTTAGGNVVNPNLLDGCGVLFQFDPQYGTYTKKVDFDGASIGGNPNGTLVKSVSGKLYGMTTHGGTISIESPSGYGVLFEFDPATSGVSGMLNFNGVEKGGNPNGSLLLASDGNFYGLTNAGGKLNMGVLFQLDPVTFTYTKKMDLKQPTGKLPDHSKLIEIAATNSISKNQPVQLQLHAFPNPGKEQVTILLDQRVSDASIKLMTLSGQCVLEQPKSSGDKFTLNIGELSQGVYFIEVTENGITSRAKLIKD